MPRRLTGPRVDLGDAAAAALMTSVEKLTAVRAQDAKAVRVVLETVENEAVRLGASVVAERVAMKHSRAPRQK